MGVWNAYLGGGVQLSAVEDASTPSQGDGKNSVFFSTSAFGEGFGDDTLAVTLTRYDTVTGFAYESDVIFNSAEPFDSYRGDQKNGRDGNPLYDLRRVAIHEFGHVLGLGHPPQNTAAIMDPVISNLDTVQVDDITGLTAVYGTPDGLPEIIGATNGTAAVGKAFSFQADVLGYATAYQASALPPGLSIDPGTGSITGTPTQAGTYHVTVTATNAAGSKKFTLTITCETPPVVTSRLAVNATVNQPFRYQFQTGGQPATFDALGPPPPGLSFDPVTGIISGTPTQVGSYTMYLSVSNLAGTVGASLVIEVIYDSTVATLHSLRPSEGVQPAAALIQAADGDFYGTAVSGGSGNDGTVFKVTPHGKLTVLHNFNGTDGAAPQTALVQGSDGNFYGRTGGPYSSVSTIFRMTPDGGVTTLQTMANTPFGDPPAALVEGADQCFYGSQTVFPEFATDTNYGMIFKITPDGTLTVLHALTANERGPSAMILGSDGNFYGTFASGNVDTAGSIFQMTPDGAVTIVHAFAAGEGELPNGVIQGSDGNFYGTTQDDESTDSTNTAFRMTPDGTFTVLHIFTGTSGYWPTGLIQGSDGNLYGTAGSEAANATLFRITGDGVFTQLHTFTTDDGYRPTPLIQAANGDFYGMIYGSSVTPSGLIFKTVPAVSVLATVAATVPTVAIGDAGAGVFTVSLSSAPGSDTVVNYTLNGSAANGIDYETLKGRVKIKANHTSGSIQIIPRGDLGGARKKMVKLGLEPGTGYTMGAVKKAKVAILAAH